MNKQMSKCSVNQTMQFQVLTTDQCKKIVDASKDILEHTGTCIHSEEALLLLKSAGCDIVDKRVYIPSSLVEKAIQSAPSQVVLYDRNGKRKLTLNGYNSYFGPGPTTPYCIDIYSGERRKTVKQDVVNTSIICEALNNIDFIMSLALVSDCPDGLADLHEVYAMLQYATKPIISWAYNVTNCIDIIDMCCTVAGSMKKLQEKPFFLLYSMPISPLVHPKESIEKLLYMAGLGLPQIYAPGMALGSTAPMTLAGCLAVGLAECLSSLVISQLKNEGTPFISNVTMGMMDMKTMMQTYGSPELCLGTAASTDIFRYLRLPTWSMAGCTDSKTLDEQAILESAIQCVISALNGASLVHDVGLMDNGITSSLELLAICDEIISMVRRILVGIDINSETLALDVISEVGPGGNFLSTTHTLTHFKRETWFPTILDRNTYQNWVNDGKLTTASRAKIKLRNILEERKESQLDNNTKIKLEMIIKKAEKRV